MKMIYKFTFSLTSKTFNIELLKIITPFQLDKADTN